MAEILDLSTPDPLFDPERPLRVNGFLFLPARRVLARKPRVPVLKAGRAKTLERTS